MTTTSSTTRTVPTSTLLTCGVLAGPVFVLTGVGQGLTRAGFDFTRHPASVLSNGSLGFLQITNFLVTGLLTIAAPAGIRRVLPRRGGPRLLAAYRRGPPCA